MVEVIVAEKLHAGITVRSVVRTGIGCVWSGELRLPVSESDSFSLHPHAIFEVFALGVRLFFISVSSPYFAHVVTHFISPHVV